MYNLVSIGGIRSGKANLDTNEVAALAIQASPSDRVLGCLFDVPNSEIAQYLEREHRYKPISVEVYDYLANSFVTALTVVEQSDNDYKESCGSEDEYFQRVGQYYQGSLWHRNDILPMKAYMVSCAFAAYELGGSEYINNYLDGTYLADRLTPLRNYMLISSDPEIKDATSQLSL